ncbi:hypothetical protein NDU88_001033 [Pleurodeles waltl]|uniref:Uncharacterized protein n=1 Tax=Pleurodeles waltl TaxID=8319 RepID=A0AAV7M1X6_PLEWA|nr:hypothetical protein NDU88_001033 [Pleurodeles waltl]
MLHVIISGPRRDRSVVLESVLVVLVEDVLMCLVQVALLILFEEAVVQAGFMVRVEAAVELLAGALVVVASKELAGHHYHRPHLLPIWQLEVAPDPQYQSFVRSVVALWVFRWQSKKMQTDLIDPSGPLQELIPRLGLADPYGCDPVDHVIENDSGKVS